VTYVVEKFGRGDVVWLEFDSRGHEQKGRRPAVVLSPAEYNTKSGLMLVCPMTTKKKGYPFEVSAGKGVVLVDQIRSVDWRARKAKKKGTVPPTAMREVRNLLGLLLP